MPPKKPAKSTTPIPIRGLATRTVETYALKALIRDTGAILTRKGRSTNWLLFAEREQMRLIVAAIENATQPSWQWLAKLIREQHQKYNQQELLALVVRNPAITVNQLVATTECTLAEARRVIDDYLELQD